MTFDRDHRRPRTTRSAADGLTEAKAPGKRPRIQATTQHGAATRAVQSKPDRATAAPAIHAPAESKWQPSTELSAALLGIGPIQRMNAAAPPTPTTAGGTGKSLPDGVRATMEQSLGTDLSSVRIHEDLRAHSLGALAYTQGTDVHFAPGQYRPDSQSGQALLGHELAHVVQQSEGRVRTTTQAMGVDVNDDPGLEAEADALGARAARGEPARIGSMSSRSRHSGEDGLVQRSVRTPASARAHGPIQLAKWISPAVKADLSAVESRFAGQPVPFGQLPVVGSGGFGTLYDLNDGFCVKIGTGTDGAINAQLQDEAKSLLSLAEQGMPTAYQGMLEWTDDGGIGREAIHQEKIEGILNKELFGTGKFSKQIVPAEKISHLNKTTITRTKEDLQALRVQLDENCEVFAAWAREQGGKNQKKNTTTQEEDSTPVDSTRIADLILDIQDLQFMISVDGSIRLVDPARVVRGADLVQKRSPKQIAKKAPSEARDYNKAVTKRIDAMIRQLEKMLG